MRRLATLVLLLVCALSSFSQEANSNDLVLLRDKKLSSPFLKCAKWTTRWDEARAAAKDSGKLILAYFTRSYAPCGPCTALEQTVLSRPDFIDLSRDVVLFCHVSSRVPSDPDGLLFCEKGGTAFPTLMVLDDRGNVLGRHCGERSIAAVRRLLAQGRAFADLIRRAEGSADLAVRQECLSKQLEYGHLDPEAARARLQSLGGLSADQQAWFDAAIVCRECDLAFLEIRRAADDPARLQAARRLVDMKERGHVPSDARTLAFWEWIMTWAAHAQDARLYEEGLAATKALLPDDPNSRELCRARQEVLDRMKREITLAGTTPMPKN